MSAYPAPPGEWPGSQKKTTFFFLGLRLPVCAAGELRPRHELKEKGPRKKNSEARRTS